VRDSANGPPVAALGLAVNNRVKRGADRWADERGFVDVVVFVAGARLEEFRGILKSEHSRRNEPKSRSHRAFAWGLRTGVFRILRPRCRTC
jgi:hypothetical protein